MKATSLFINSQLVYIIIVGVKGFGLHLNSDEGTPGHSRSCQVVCEDLTLRPSNTPGMSSSSGDTLHKSSDKNDGAVIERMSLFKVSSSGQSLLAEVSSTKNIVSQSSKVSSVEGLLSSNYATLQLDLFDPTDCYASFTCQVLMSDGQVKVREMTNDQSEPVTSAHGLTTSSVDDLTSRPTKDLTTISASAHTAPSKDDKIVTCDKTLDMIPHLLTLVEDLKAEVAIMQIKFDEIHFIKERLSTQLTSSEQRLKTDFASQVAELQTDITSSEQRQRDEMEQLASQITSSEQRLKKDFASQVAALQTDITSAEQRLTDEISNIDQRQKSEISNIQQSLVGLFSATERRLTTKMSETETNLQMNSERELSRLEDKLNSALQQTDDAGCCSEPLMTALIHDIQQLNKGIADSVSSNISILNHDLVGTIEKSYNNFVNVSNDLGDKLDHVIVSVLSISQSLENATCNYNTSSLTETLRQDLSSISHINDGNDPVLKHSECKKYMLPVHAPAQYPYPVFYPDQSSIIDKPFLCDTKTTSGGWIVIQYRKSGDVSFYRGWEEYKAGFGSLDDDFWLGLEAIHQLTSSARFELRIDLKYKGQSAYALYSRFSVGNECDNYKLDVGGYSGTAGDSLSGHHNGMEFTTKDRDNDKHSSTNCASYFTGAWWYNKCHHSNFNGLWLRGSNKGLRWSTFTKEDSASFSEIKIRRV